MRLTRAAPGRQAVFEPGIPIGPAAAGRQVEKAPQQRRVDGAARILAGVSGLVAHLVAPRMTDRAVLADEDVERGDVAFPRLLEGIVVVEAVVRRGIKRQEAPTALALE